MSVLFILFPFTHIFRPIGVCVSALPICFVVEPLTFIDIPVRVVEDALAVGLIVMPLPNILAAICPNLGPHAFPHGLFPLSFVGDAIVKFDGAQLDYLLAIHCGLNKLVIFFSFSSLEKVGNSLFDLPVPIIFRFYGFRVASCSCGISFSFGLVLLRSFLIGFAGLFGRIYFRVFARFWGQEVLIF